MNITKADILLLIDSEAGHIYPTLLIASQLRDEGYTVVYTGLEADCPIVESKGFAYYNMFSMSKTEATHKKDHFGFLVSDAIDEFMQALRPKIILQSSFMVLEGLILHYKYQIPLLTYCSYFLEKTKDTKSIVRELLGNACVYRFMQLSGDTPQKLLALIREKNKSASSLADLALPVKNAPIIFLYPEELQIHQRKRDEAICFAGPGILEAINEETFDIDSLLPKGKKLIFLSMGSQIKKYPEKTQKVFETAVASMQAPEMDDYHLFITTGGNQVAFLKKQPSSERVSIFDWLPQKEVLQHASLAVVHGGLGTLKETIYYGVPTIIIPMGRDQMDNALRIQHHHLGKIIDVEKIHASYLSKTLLEVLNDTEITENVSRVCHIFKQQNAQKTALQFVEKHLKNTVEITHENI